MGGFRLALAFIEKARVLRFGEILHPKTWIQWANTNKRCDEKRLEEFAKWLDVPDPLYEYLKLRYKKFAKAEAVCD